MTFEGLPFRNDVHAALTAKSLGSKRHSMRSARSTMKPTDILSFFLKLLVIIYFIALILSYTPMRDLRCHTSSL